MVVDCRAYGDRGPEFDAERGRLAGGGASTVWEDASVTIKYINAKLNPRQTVLVVRLIMLVGGCIRCAGRLLDTLLRLRLCIYRRRSRLSNGWIRKIKTSE